MATEELTFKNMTRSGAGTVEEPGKQVSQKAGLNREILDTAPGLFTSLFRYKVLETGGEWVDAPTRKLKPSQRCPQCWHVAKKQLSQRMHCCEQCGHEENRDTASARVVLRWALESISGQELAETGVILPVKLHPLQRIGWSSSFPGIPIRRRYVERPRNEALA